MQYSEDNDYHYEPEDEPDHELDFTERMKVMLNGLRRAPSMTVREWKEAKQRYRAWREEQLAPFVKALATMIVADLTRGAK